MQLYDTLSENGERTEMGPFRPSHPVSSLRLLARPSPSFLFCYSVFHRSGLHEERNSETGQLLELYSPWLASEAVSYLGYPKQSLQQCLRTGSGFGK